MTFLLGSMFLKKCKTTTSRFLGYKLLAIFTMNPMFQEQEAKALTLMISDMSCYKDRRYTEWQLQGLCLNCLWDSDSSRRHGNLKKL
jgi:hypothetical protein